MKIDNLLKQAQQLQEKMHSTQEAIAAMNFTGVSGGGMVKITINGKGDFAKVDIDKSLINPEEVDILEDLLIAAANDARSKLETYTAEQMGQLTAGLPLPGPGMKFPF